MAKRIELPQLPAGSEKEQLQTLYSYLYRMAEALNNNLAEIGGAELTDGERAQMKEIIGDGNAEDGRTETETLKSLIIKTAAYIKTSIDQYNMRLIGTYEAEGKFGKYVRNTQLDVDVTPSGITQNYKFSEIIQGLKTYEVNAKNYIKTGYLRTENSLPVYGVAIGKDIVTFSSDGTETYNDGNKVAELTADELSFWQNGGKVASYKGDRISFYYGNTEVFYIQAGKIYCTQDMEISGGKKITINKWVFDENGLLYKDASDNEYNLANEFSPTNSTKGGVYFLSDANGGIVRLYTKKLNNTAYAQLNFESAGSNLAYLYAQGTRFAVLGNRTYPYSYTYLQYIVGRPYMNAQNVEAGADVNFLLNGFNSETQTAAQMYTGQYFRITADWSDTTNKAVQFVASGPIVTSQKLTVNNAVDGVTTITATTVKYTNLIQNSSREIKHDIRDMEPAGEKLDRLRPVTFIYDEDPEERQRNGLIYEEAAEVMPEICTDDESNKAVSYMELVPILLKEIQELRARVKALEER